MSTPASRGMASWDDEGREAADLLSALICIDTSNPPGNETSVARYLDEFLSVRGIVGEIAGELPDRMNYVARLDGRRPGPTLLLLSHTDVVPIDGQEWIVPPFSGVIRDSYIWGRGAVDMKNMLAAEAIVLARLAEAGADFTGSVVLCCVADEEVGNHSGGRLVDRKSPRSRTL